MSLVVASVHEDGPITLVADTKVTLYHRDGRTLNDHATRHIFEHALPKLVIMRPDLAVGVTGANPHSATEQLIARRDDGVEEILQFATTLTSSGLVVAALHPARLWHVADGHIYHRTNRGIAWDGSQGAFEIFCSKRDEWPPGMEQEFLLMSSMQFLTSFNPVPSVGGYALGVHVGDSGFEFFGYPTVIGPSPLIVTAAQRTDETVRIEFEPPDDLAAASGFRLQILPGRPPTQGALGLLLPEARLGLLFTHERPWEVCRFAVNTADALASHALAQHGQHLAGA